MSQFLRKAFLSRASSAVSIRNPNLNALRMRWFSVSSGSDDDKAYSFTVSYLINSIGLSPKNALLVSKYVNLKTEVKPDKAIAFLKNFGFTETQISTLVRSYPQVLLSNTGKTLSPKLEFLKSKGISVPELVKSLSTFPYLLRASLSNQIIPSYDFLRDLLQSDEKTVSAIKRFPDILSCRIRQVVLNTDVLREHGVPDPKIARWIECIPKSLVYPLDQFRRVVEEVEGMGFDASTTKFALAVHLSLVINKSTWESKGDAYKKCGFSEEEVSRVFRSHPNCMLHSEGKISAAMDFLVNEMGLEHSVVATNATVLGLSLKKRIIPRCSVFKFLVSRGLVEKKKVNVNLLLMSSEERFLKKYVEPYVKEGPELMKVYSEKLIS